MASVLWLNQDQMMEFCRDHMRSVFREAGVQITPLLPLLGNDWDGWEKMQKAEADINEAVTRGDYKDTVARCDSYLKRVAATVGKHARKEAA